MNNRITVGKGYRKYHFPNSEKAKEAQKKLGERFPNMKTKVNEHGSLFCHENGSINFHLLILSYVSRMGGMEAEA